MKTTGPSNPNTQALIQVLNKSDQPKLWRRVADLMSRPSRSKRVLNVDQLNDIVNDGDVVVIPTKILGSGVINKKVVVGALQISSEAKRKITSAGGSVLSIVELWEKHPKGTNVRIIR